MAVAKAKAAAGAKRAEEKMAVAASKAIAATKADEWTLKLRFQCVRCETRHPFKADKDACEEKCRSMRDQSTFPLKGTVGEWALVPPTSDFGPPASSSSSSGPVLKKARQTTGNDAMKKNFKKTYIQSGYCLEDQPQ